MAEQILDVQKVIGSLPSVLAPNTFYAVRVGTGYDLYLSDATGAVAHRLNTDLDKLGWQLITTATDLNTLTETGQYFLQASNNPNAPNGGWLFVEVDKGNNERLKQIAFQDNNVTNHWIRHRLGSTWGSWVKIINQNDLNSRMNATNVGGRNLLIGSNVSLNQHGSINLNISPNIDYGLVRHLTIACDIYYKNAVKSTKAGNKWWRAGVLVKITYTDGTTQDFSSFQVVTTSPTNYNARRLARFTVPNGKTIKSIGNAFIQIWDIDADEIVVKNPKLELYHIMTDWSPASEDHQAEIDTIKAEIAELKRQWQSGSVGGTSFGD